MKKRRLLLIIPIYLLALLFLPISFSVRNPNFTYENVISSSVTNKDAKIVDIAMLGAHDAFTNGINYASKPNYNEGSIVTNKAVNIFGKGFVIRLSKAQNADALQMLYAGVRYFDVRIDYEKNDYYACHGLLSNKLSYYVQDIVDFLGDHNGEFIIFDIQEFFTENGSNYNVSLEEYNALVEAISKVKNKAGKSLIDYVHYDALTTNVGTLTYGEVIGSDAGVIMLAKVEGSNVLFKRDGNAYYDITEYTTIRSLWHESNSSKQMLEGINNECKYLEEHPYDNILVVNQAQKTGFLMNKSIVRSIFSWSLLDMANNFNKQLVKDKDQFMEWLDVMPIFMVDNVTSNKGKFTKLANEYIMEKNKGL